jgi:hypothetical protein
VTRLAKLAIEGAGKTRRTSRIEVRLAQLVAGLAAKATIAVAHATTRSLAVAMDALPSGLQRV